MNMMPTRTLWSARMECPIRSAFLFHSVGRGPKVERLLDSGDNVSELDRLLQPGDTFEPLRDHFLIISCDEYEWHAVPLEVIRQIE